MVEGRTVKLTDPSLRRRRLGILLVLAAFILLMIGALLVNAQLGDNLSQRYAPTHHALLYFKTDVTLGHLWLEELLLGSPQTSLEEVRALHASSLGILDTLVNGGVIDASFYQPSADPARLRPYVELRDQLWNCTGSPNSVFWKDLPPPPVLPQTSATTISSTRSWTRQTRWKTAWRRR